MLKAAALVELQRAVTTLEAERAAIDEAISALKRVLQHYVTSERDIAVGVGVRGDTYEGMTMREIVAKHLREHPGWKAGDVTRQLRSEGYTRGGATRFSHRVYNEIWRMEKDGLVTKDEHGGFHLKE